MIKSSINLVLSQCPLWKSEQISHNLLSEKPKTFRLLSPPVMRLQAMTLSLAWICSEYVLSASGAVFGIWWPWRLWFRKWFYSLARTEARQPNPAPNATMYSIEQYCTHVLYMCSGGGKNNQFMSHLLSHIVCIRLDANAEPYFDSFLQPQLFWLLPITKLLRLYFQNNLVFFKFEQKTKSKSLQELIFKKLMMDCHCQSYLMFITLYWL